MGGEEEASLLPSHFGRGGGFFVFTGVHCAGTYSMGQPRRVSTQSSRRQGLWRRPGRWLRKTAEPGPGRQPARGICILVPVRRRVETGPGREASGGRRVTWRCFRGGRPSQGKRSDRDRERARAGGGGWRASACGGHPTGPARPPGLRRGETRPGVRSRPDRAGPGPRARRQSSRGPGPTHTHTRGHTHTQVNFFSRILVQRDYFCIFIINKL